MLATLTHEHFEACLNQIFRVRAETGESLELTLVEVNKLGRFDPDTDKRQAFSLVLRGPVEPLLPQMIHAMENDTIGALELFMVPIGPDGEGMRYEVIFT